MIQDWRGYFVEQRTRKLIDSINLIVSENLSKLTLQ